jgi:hypothetical protein
VDDKLTVKSDVSRVAFEKALDGVGRAEVESRYRRAVFEHGEMTQTLTIAQEMCQKLHAENVELKNALRVAKILLENERPDRALQCICSALLAPNHSEEVPANEDHR